MIFHKDWHPYRNIARLIMVSKDKGILDFYYFQGSKHKMENRQLVMGQGNGKWVKKQIRNKETNSYLWNQDQAIHWCEFSESAPDWCLPVILQCDYSGVIK